MLHHHTALSLSKKEETAENDSHRLAGHLPQLDDLDVFTR